MREAGGVSDEDLVRADTVTVRAVGWGQRHHPAAVGCDEIADGWHAAMVGRGSDNLGE